MWIERKYLPELCVSKDFTRDALLRLNVTRTHIGVSGANGYLLATDGRRLVVVPCELEPEDVPGSVRSDILNLAKRFKSAVASKVWMRLGKNRVRFIDGTILRRGSSDVPFPESTNQVVPTTEPSAVSSVAFDPKLFYEMAKAMGCLDGVTVTFHGFGRPMVLRPALLDPAEAKKTLGLLMPLTV